IGLNQAVCADSGPGAGVRAEGDADFRISGGDELELDIGILFPKVSFLFDAPALFGGAIQVAAFKGAPVLPFFREGDRHPRDVNDRGGIQSGGAGASANLPNVMLDRSVLGRSTGRMQVVGHNAIKADTEGMLVSWSI